MKNNTDDRKNRIYTANADHIGEHMSDNAEKGGAHFADTKKPARSSSKAGA